MEVLHRAVDIAKARLERKVLELKSRLGGTKSKGNRCQHCATAVTIHRAARLSHCHIAPPPPPPGEPLYTCEDGCHHRRMTRMASGSYLFVFARIFTWSQSIGIVLKHCHGLSTRPYHNTCVQNIWRILPRRHRDACEERNIRTVMFRRFNLGLSSYVARSSERRRTSDQLTLPSPSVLFWGKYHLGKRREKLPQKVKSCSC